MCEALPNFRNIALIKEPRRDMRRGVGVEGCERYSGVKIPQPRIHKSINNTPQAPKNIPPLSQKRESIRHLGKSREKFQKRKGRKRRRSIYKRRLFPSKIPENGSPPQKASFPPHLFVLGHLKYKTVLRIHGELASPSFASTPPHPQGGLPSPR